MYTATMQYRFKNGQFQKACTIWQDHVIAAAKGQPGFIRMQLLVAEPDALAIGTWKSKLDAEAFMQTGVFKRLMVDLEGLCDGQPVPKIWELKYFEQT